MGWTNSHLYEIRARDVAWSTPYPDQDWDGDFLDSRKARLGDVLEDVGTKALKYLYDFGDGWEHTIKVERLIDPESGVLYPRLIEAKGHCPPEDIGGPWGYSEFLEAIADPSHERHRELKEWFADDFNRRAAPPGVRGGGWAMTERCLLETGKNELRALRQKGKSPFGLM